MCLETLKDFKVKLNEQEVGLGWKVFKFSANKSLFGQFCGTFLERSRGKWLREEDFRPSMEENICKKWMDIYGKYRTGWHVFHSRESARSWKRRWTGDIKNKMVVKVKYRNVITLGFDQHGNKVIVAKEIFIPKGN
ncbi:hypothetical protein KA005_62275 [bacterium]|nr:hypothetical protein [bacterium]